LKEKRTISFDVHPLLGEKMSGVGYCEAGLLTELLQSHPENQYQFHFFSFRNQKEKEERLKKYKTEQVDYNCSHFSGFLYRSILPFFPLPYACFFGKKAKITHFFNYIVPPGVAGKTVVTVHDMVIKAFPETVRWKTRILLSLGLNRSLQRADKIVTDSFFSKKEIIKYYPAYEKKIRVVPCGVDVHQFYPMKDEREIVRVKQKLKITGDYFLYVGTIEPRKNLYRLIEAYSLVLKKDPSVPSLILAGSNGWLNENLFVLIKEKGLEEKVHFTEYVASEDRCALYNGAIGFLFPSIYEGFGMPPLEAMACGVPVLVSKEASLPEIVGDAGIYVNAYEVSSIADGLEKLSTDKKLREKLSQRGLKQAQKYTWKQATEKLYKIYEELFDE